MLKSSRAPAGRQNPIRASKSHREWEKRYRERWRWDKAVWATHCVDCYPGACPFRVYVKDGRIVAEEQSGTFPVIENGVPDMNPMGCQKGVAWSRLLHAKERVLHPLKRAGRRGEGKWTQVTWDQAPESAIPAYWCVCVPTI